MFKSRLTLFILLFITNNSNLVNAQAQKLIVWQRSGKQLLIELAEQPLTTFSSDSLTIITTAMSVSLPLSEVLRYTYQQMTQDIHNTLSDSKPVSIRRQGDDVVIEHLEPGQIVSLCSADGKLIRRQIASNTGAPIVFSLTGRPKGVYIVNTSNENIKVLKP